MDRNSIIGIVLIVAILLGYQLYTAPSAEQRARMEQVQDSLANAVLEQQARQAEETARQQAATRAADTLTTALATDTGRTADSLRNALSTQR